MWHNISHLTVKCSAGPHTLKTGMALTVRGASEFLIPSFTTVFFVVYLFLIKPIVNTLPKRCILPDTHPLTMYAMIFKLCLYFCYGDRISYLAMVWCVMILYGMIYYVYVAQKIACNNIKNFHSNISLSNVNIMFPFQCLILPFWTWNWTIHCRKVYMCHF